MPIRWKVRTLWAALMFSFVFLLFWIHPGPNDPRALIAVLPIPLGFLLSRFWPRCPHCRARVIRSQVDWLEPSAVCPDCDQEYDGPHRSRAERSLRRLPLLVQLGVISPSDAELLSMRLVEEERLRQMALTDNQAASELLHALQDQLAHQRRLLNEAKVNINSRLLRGMHAEVEGLSREVDELRTMLRGRVD